MSECLLFNGMIYGYPNPKINAVYIENHLIKAIGDYQSLKPLLKNITNQIDLKQNALLPAFTDTHTHFFVHSRLKDSLILCSAKSIDDIRAHFLEYRKRINTKTKWIRGWGWDLNRYAHPEDLNIKFLDKYFPDIPVSLDSYDLHSKLCNSLALEKANINANTPDPPGGRIGKDYKNELTGYVYELAWELINRIIPDYSQAEKIDLIKSAIKDAWQYGISGVHVMEDETTFKLYENICQGSQDFRFTWHFPSDILDQMINRQIISYSGDDFIRYGGMKIYMDGALGSHTAWMDESYPDEPNNFGSKILDPNDLYNLVLKAGKHKIASSIHAIGNRCVHEVIEAINKVNDALGYGLPHRIEHLQCINPEDITLLKQSKAYCAMQPVHMKEDIAVIEKIWGKASQNAFLFRTLLNNKIPLAFGSDAPVETINPFQGIYSAIKRQARNDPNQKIWNKNQCITVEESIAAYTDKASFISGLSHKTGSIDIGKWADLFVIDKNYREDETFWLTAKSLLTIVHGNCVYIDL